MRRLGVELSYSESFLKRHVTCRHYEDCLMRAAVEEWKSFSCHECPVFKKYLKEMRRVRAEKKRENERRKGLLGRSSENLWQFG